MARSKWIVTALILVLALVIGTSQAQQRTHTVKRGETLSSIAQTYGVTVEGILLVNSLINPNTIFAGQVLVIPTGTVSLPRTYTVQAGDKLADIATRFNTTVQALAQLNNIINPNAIQVGNILVLPPIGGPLPVATTYTVDRGDTLRTIAERFGTTWQTLASYNALANANLIYAGMVLRIPPAGYVPPVTTPVPTPRPTQAPPVVNPPQTPINGTTYTVVAGDSLFTIATRARVNVYALAQANGILNLNVVYVGQVLRIPR